MDRTEHPNADVAAERIAAEIPDGAGIGLKPAHAPTILRERPKLGWLEVHAENYMVPGGPRLAMLEAMRETYPLSLHGVGLSLGGADRPDRAHLEELRALVRRYQPRLVSEHIAWSAHDGIYFADLLPTPLTAESLARLCRNIAETQDVLGQRILIENPSSYLRLPRTEIPEHEFLADAARRTGCGLLIDVNNVYVSAYNLGFDARTYLDALPGEPIDEIHLAGFSLDQANGAPFLIDSHGAPVASAVWDLFDRLIQRIGPRPTLIEWDNDIPAWEVLHAEALEADRILSRRRQPAAVAA